MATRRSRFPASRRTRLERRSCAVRARSFALALLLLAAAGCRNDAADPNSAHEDRVTAAIGTPATIHCAGETCRVTALQPLHSTDEAWLIALPVVAGVNGDPGLAAIRRLDVSLMDKSGMHEARFACSLPHESAGSGSVTVDLVHELCRGTFSGF